VVFIRVHHHVAWVLVIQILEQTLYLKCYLFLYVLKLRDLSILEVTKEPILFLGPPLVC